MLVYLEAFVIIFSDLQRFKGTGPADSRTLGAMQFGEPPSDPFLPYRVNVFVDNSDTQGPPIIVETNPTYHNVFGVVEKKPIAGGYFTDFTLIKPGSISRANGGYLVLYDRDVLSNAGVWEALQRVIKHRELRIEEPSAFFGFVPPQGLRPEPIPTDTKVIMIGDPFVTARRFADTEFRETSRQGRFQFCVDARKKTSRPSRALSATTAIARGCAISTPPASRGSSNSAPGRWRIKINFRPASAIWLMC